MDARLQQDRVAAGHWLERLLQDIGRYNALRPLIIGIVHGLAGSAAVALLVMTTIHDPWWSITYLLLFGIGTVAGTMLITTVPAMPFAFTARNSQDATAKWLLSPVYYSKSWIRRVSLLSNRFCRGPVHVAPAMDSSLIVWRISKGAVKIPGCPVHLPKRIRRGFTRLTISRSPQERSSECYTRNTRFAIADALITVNLKT